MTRLPGRLARGAIAKAGHGGGSECANRPDPSGVVTKYPGNFQVKPFFGQGMAVVCLAALLFFGVALAQEEPETIEFKGEITLGATFPLTGELSYYGQSAYFGAATRVKLINAAGGVNGKRLVLQWRDNRGEPEQAIRDVEELVRDHGVPAVIGPLLSDGAMAVRDLAEKQKVVIVTPMGTVDAATLGNPWMFRVCFTNSAEAEGLISFQMNAYGAKSCGIIYDPRHAFSTELATIFAKKFTEKGGRVVGKQAFVNADGEKDYEKALTTLNAENPDFIFAASYAMEAVEMIHAARDLGIRTRFCGSDTWDNELLFDAAGTRLIGTSFASSLFEQNFNYKPFQTFFTAMEQAGMDNPDAQAACAYDAVTLIADCMQTAGEKPEEIRDCLFQVRRKPLATGRISITSAGDAVKPIIIRIVERRGGRLIPIYAERYDP